MDKTEQKCRHEFKEGGISCVRCYSGYFTNKIGIRPAMNVIGQIDGEEIERIYYLEAQNVITSGD